MEMFKIRLLKDLHDTENLFKNHWIVNIKQTNFMVCKLDINKAVEGKKEVGVREGKRKAPGYDTMKSQESNRKSPWI